MASYTETEKKAVQELIDKYIQDSLDNYVRTAIKEAVITKMNKGLTAIEVADIVFEQISNTLICPKAILLVLRKEIITTLS
jgi:hypothetical protein